MKRKPPKPNLEFPRITEEIKIGLRNGNPSGHGGKRPNAGRKKDLPLEGLKAFDTPEKVGEWMGDVEHLAKHSISDKTRLAALTLLLDRVLGKPTQHSDVKVKATTGAMTDEELLDAAREMGVPIPPGLEKPTK